MVVYGREIIMSAGIIVAWMFVGFYICFLWGMEKKTDGWELCNPYWAYKYHKSVNWFGAIFLSLVYTALCPIGAIIHWFYTLCTIGRR